MVGVKKTRRQHIYTSGKKLYILNIIILFISSSIPLIDIAQPQAIDPPQTFDSITNFPEQGNPNTYREATSATSWWNTNWHYRRIYNITGIGNISVSVNFTALLRSLKVNNKTFENSTITIVRQYTNGTMIVVNKTWFNESATFHNRTNALGTLTWEVSDTASYCVYFDVVENRGTRDIMTETLNLKASVSPPRVTKMSTQGWWPEFLTTFQTHYLINETVPVQVYTTALTTNVTAYFYYNGTINFTKTFNTLDNLNWNTAAQCSKIGDWTIRVIGYDDAGYQNAPLTIGFYIGKPDLIATALAVPAVCYIGYNVTVTAHMRAVNTTVKNVDVALRVDNLNVDTEKNLTIQKNENKTLQFQWTPASLGSHNVSFYIHYHLDSNQSNNIIWKIVTVEGIPDLAVLNITIAPTPVDEGDPVSVTAYIRNKGDGNASGYKIELFCEQNGTSPMSYSQSKNSTTFNLQKNKSTNITLVWERTQYGKTTFHGEWAVGIKIRNETQTPDKNEADNKKELYHVLKVIAAERNPPLLTNLEYLSSIELGSDLLIHLKATDASGIDTVVISLKRPNKTYVNASMTEETNDRYSYLFTTTQLGRHDFTIKATDRSPNKNQSIITGYFMVTQDQTPPTITYYGVNPPVQLPNKPVEIRCITSDYSGIRSAEVTIRFPDDLVQTHVMKNPLADTKYIYTQEYETTGKYVFSIKIEDPLGNQKITEEKTFWITNDLDDTDNDGIPDDWEERYELNPYDPNDASGDEDNDGFTNVEEYQQGTNPLKKSSSSSEIMERLQENWAYLTASIIVFVIIVLLAGYGIRRRSP